MEYTHTLPLDYKKIIFPRFNIQEYTIGMDPFDGAEMHMWHKYGMYPARVLYSTNVIRINSYVRKLHTDGFYYLCPIQKQAEFPILGNLSSKSDYKESMIKQFIAEVYKMLLLSVVVPNDRYATFVRDPDQTIETARIQL